MKLSAKIGYIVPLNSERQKSSEESNDGSVLRSRVMSETSLVSNTGPSRDVGSRGSKLTVLTNVNHHKDDANPHVTQAEGSRDDY